MSQVLVADLRRLAQSLAGDAGQARADVTAEFWRVGRELRAALPPLLLPGRPAAGKPRIGYLVARPDRLPGILAELDREHRGGAHDVWLFMLGGEDGAPDAAWAQVVDLRNRGELQAARVVAVADLDVLVDLDGAALAAAPLLVALRPARAIIEPLCEPASTALPTPAVEATSDVALLAQAARAADDRLARLRPAAATPVALNGRLEAGVRLHQAGDFAGARRTYESVLADCPEHPVANYLLGQLLHHQGQAGAAISCLQRAASAAPEFRDAHYTLGQRLAEVGRWSEALAAYRSAVDLTPRFAAGWSGLGLAALHVPDAGTRAAIGHLERAVALDPDSLEWRFNLGTALQRAGELAAARKAYEQVLARNPGHVDALFNLGAVAQEQGDHSAGIAAYRAVLRQQPGFAAAYPQLGACLQLTGQVEAWLENYRVYRAACAETLTMAVYGLEASMAAGDPAAHVDWRDRILAGNVPAASPEEFTRAWEQLLFLLLHVDADRAVLHGWYAAYDAAARAVYGEASTATRPRRPGRARIGYLSGDLRDHVMGRMIFEWVSRHDRARYDIVLYSLSPVRDAFTARLQALGVPMVDIGSRPLASAAARIRDDDIDLLIDCSGHTRGAQPGILALKPARVQATHIATPGPVGLRAIDYKLTEPLAESDDAQQFQLERLLSVPGGVFPWRRYPAAGGLERAAVGLDPGAFVCGAFVSLMKLSPRCLNLWRRVLERVPRAVLAFSPAQPSWRPAYLRWLQAHGIGGDRVVFIPCPSDEAGQLARYHALDVALDPLPCGNVNGTMEALAMGVPVVTLVGPRHGERLGNALLTRFGLTGTIAADAEDYLALIERLAGDPCGPREVRGLVAQRLLDSPVWDANAHVQGLEAAYDQMLAGCGVTLGVP
ncbi:MAG: tetratricopeptide repeat protein [Betaproteobacteria bacterium]|nr:tetratricopeptide repeat protein [Betaproteobacteria bacterium]